MQVLLSARNSHKEQIGRLATQIHRGSRPLDRSQLFTICFDGKCPLGSRPVAVVGANHDIVSDAVACSLA
jgi:hypothetical protein